MQNARRFGFLSLVALTWSSFAAVLSAQERALPAPPLPAWSDGFEYAGATGDVKASVVYDDGSGPALYFGGRFDLMGASRAFGIARFDGETVTVLTPGVSGGGGVGGRGGNTEVNALAVHDIGGGPALIVGGAFDTVDGVAAESLAAWDGSSWSAIGDVGPFGVIEAMHSDGASLYVGGQFSSIDGTPANNVAVWSNGAWSALGAGLGAVSALTVATVAGQIELYAGRITSPLARWDGNAWSDVPGTPNTILALAAFPLGGGVVLIGGNFRLSAWNGTTYSAVSDDAPVYVRTLLVDAATPAPRIYAGAQVRGSAPEAGGLVVWESGGWTPIGAPTPGAKLFQDEVLTLALASLGGGPTELFVGGEFTEIGGSVAFNVARAPVFGTDPARALVDGRGVSRNVNAMISYDDGTGSALWIGGGIGHVGTTHMPGVARLRAEVWETVGEPFGANNVVSAFAAYNDGTGRALYAVGRLLTVGQTPVLGVVRWDGTEWSDVGGGLVGNTGNLNDAVVYDDGDGPVLVVGGSFYSSPTLPGANIAQWDGATWSHVGGGLTGGSRNVQSLATHDDGTGMKLYAAGDFLDAGGVPVNGIARWDGATWEAVGSGVNAANFDNVYDLESVDIPELGGRVLVAAGDFSHIGGVLANGIGYWRDGAWHHLDRGFFNFPRVTAVTSYNDGTGPVLVAGGEFWRSTAGAHVGHLARWVNGKWSSFATSLRRPSSQGGGVWSLATRRENGERVLWVGGGFQQAGAKTSVNLARWARPQRVRFELKLVARVGGEPAALELTVPAELEDENAFLAIGDREDERGLTRVLHVERLTLEGKATWPVPAAVSGRGLCAQVVLLRNGELVVRSDVVALED